MNTLSGKVPFYEKMGYALGDTASNLVWMFLVFYIQYFYTDVFGLRPEDMAVMFIAIRLFDSANDPIMGIIADRTESRWGKFRPYILWVALPFGVITWLSLTTPEWGYHSKLVYAYVTYSLMMVIYTAINIPYSALMGVISSNSQERTSISGLRFVMAQFGGIIVQVMTIILVVYYGGGTVEAPGNEQVGYSRTGLTFGIAAALLFLVTFITTKERIKPPKDQQTNLKSDLSDLGKNIPWWILFAIGVFTIAYVCVRNGAIMYYFKYYSAEKALRFEFFGKEYYRDLASTFMIVGTGVSLLSNAIVGWLSRLFGGKKKMFISFMALTAILTAAFWFLPAEATGMMFLLQILISFTSGPTGALVWAMYADSADYSEYKNGRRATGLIFSAATASQKLGWTIGGALSGFLLAFFNYQANSATPDAIEGIRLLISFIPAVTAVLAAGAMLLYPLSDKKMAEIEEELLKRRKDSSEDDVNAELA